LELRRDWARLETYELTVGIAKRCGGPFGVGLQYAETMIQSRGAKA
jgi:hypothetical protein